MKPIIYLLAALTPVAAFAADQTFECAPEGSQIPELTAKLIKIDGQDKGLITVDGAEMEAQVFTSLGGMNFLHIGDGFTYSYDINVETGAVKFSASGSKTGFGKGICSEI